jgi:hypothetical protein
MTMTARAARGAGGILTALVLALLAALPAAAHDARPSDLPERRLRALEQQVLGSAHAAAHARERAYRRSPAGRRASRRQRSRPLARAAVAGPADQVGRWGAPFGLPVVGTHAVMLPTGKVLLFAATVAFRADEAHAYLWDPRTGATRQVNPPLDTGQANVAGTGRPVNVFGAGHSLMADGRVLVTGGTLRYDWEVPGRGWAGLAHTYVFDPFTERWSRQPDMRAGRWYPSQALLPDGRTLIVSGELDSGEQPEINEDVETFTPTGGGAGRIDLIGTAPSTYSYPHLFWMPSRRMLMVSAYPRDTFWLDPFAPGGLRVTDLPDHDQAREWSSAVLMPGGTAGSTRVAVIGGADIDTGAKQATAATIVFDEADPGAGWQRGAISPLNVGRQSHNTVILPDGGLVTVGGGSDGVDKAAGGFPRRDVELLDPGARQWRLGAEQAEDRAYHSSALLLPDGRVLSAGDDRFGGERSDTGELYSPPYLFRGPRPAITSAPAEAGYGDVFGVGSADAGLRRAVLVALGSSTHAVNWSQRHVELEVVRSRPGQGVDVRTPGPDLAPPGYYMLFLLDERGVPSISRFVRLGADARDAPELPDPTTPTPPTTPVTPPADPPQQPPRGGDGDAKGPPPGARLRLALDRAPRSGAVTGLTGTVAGLPAGARVQAALALRAGSRCRWWSTAARRFDRRARGCATARGWARASVRRGTWRVALRGRGTRGRRLVATARVVARDGRTLAVARRTLR